MANIQTRRNFLKTTGLIAAAISLPGCAKTITRTSPKRPNIVIIMSDDHSSHLVSSYGSFRNKTPNIDRIAREGMRLKNCFAVNAICGPSRAAIITGKYGHMTGFVRNSMRINEKDAMVSEVLKKGGYQTAIVGKWHLSKNDAKSPPRGFDYWNILPGQGAYVNPDMFEMGQRKNYEGYTTDIITELSLDWLKKCDSSKPFMVMVHHKAPHSPWQYNSKYEKMAGNEKISEPETLWDNHSGRSKAAAGNGRNLKGLLKTMKSDKWATGAIDVEGLSDKEAIEKTYQKFLADYIRTVASVDESVGRIRNYLEEKGILDDTVFIYTSDQGFFLGEHGWHNKRMFYEESIRMPFIARYPKEIKAGSTSDALVLNIDIAETFCDYADVNIPADMQGSSIRQVLAGNTPSDWRESMFYRYYQGSGVPLHYGVRTDRYKLIYYTETEEWELFDIEKYPGEMKSIYDDPRYKGTVKSLKEELGRLCKQYDVTDDFLNNYKPIKVPN